MALYRFLFAPVLLAVAVLTTSPRRGAPQPPRPVLVRDSPPVLTPAAPVRAAGARVGPSHPGTVR